MKNQKAFIIFAWLIYTVAYLGRYSYSSNITFIMADYGVEHASAGLATTFFFFAYGVGQVVNGLLCKYYNKKYVISAALLISSVINITIYLGIPFVYIKYLWLINGLMQSVLWPSLISTLGKYLDEKNLKKGIIVMGTTTGAGTLLSYGLSAAFGQWGSYKYSFITATIVMSAVAIAWFVASKYIMHGEYVPVAEEAVNVAETTPAEDGKTSSPKRKILYFMPLIASLAIFSVVNSLVKDGLTTWLPSILKESYGLKDSISIFTTMFLPLMAAFGGIIVVFINKKIHDMSIMTGLLITINAVLIGVVILLLKTPFWLIILICFAIISMFAGAVNNVVTNMAPLYLRNFINTGALVGILDGFCYLGSTMSSYGLGLIADNFGWMGVFAVLLSLAILSVVIVGVIWLASRRRKKNLSE